MSLKHPKWADDDIIKIGSGHRKGRDGEIKRIVEFVFDKEGKCITSPDKLKLFLNKMIL